MTREEEIKEMAKINASHITSDKDMQVAFADALRRGAEWADSHPRWISVGDDLPKIDWTMSDTVVVTDGNGGLRLAWYHQDEGWHFATGLTFEPTHWMRLPQAPSSSEFPNNCKKGGEG